jgi:hypothetical protein
MVAHQHQKDDQQQRPRADQRPQPRADAPADARHGHQERRQPQIRHPVPPRLQRLRLAPKPLPALGKDRIRRLPIPCHRPINLP